MPLVSPLINRGQVGYWLEEAPSGGKLLTVDNDGQVTEATVEQVQDAANLSAALQAAIPAPLAIEEGRVYTVQENQQVAFRFPVAVDGVLRVDGILYEV